MSVAPVGSAAQAPSVLAVAPSPVRTARAAASPADAVASPFRLLLASPLIESAPAATPNLAADASARGAPVHSGASAPGLAGDEGAPTLGPPFDLRSDPRLDPWRHKHSLTMPDTLPAAAAAPPTPFAPLVAPTAASAVERPPPTLEDLFPALVRRVAWSGDRHRGSLRLEIGSGDLQGATLIVHAEERRVRVEMQVPPGADVEAWQSRLEQSLAARGVEADSVQVR